MRYGSASLGIVAAVIAAVIILNVAFTALCSGSLWFIDLSPESTYNDSSTSTTTQKTTTLYALMDETVSYLENIFADAEADLSGDGHVEVEIIFCAEPDLLKKSDTMRYVYYTALNMQKQFPQNIKVSYRDVWENPSSVDMYRANSYSNIYQSNIIVASGSEFRISSVQDYYFYDEDLTTITAYNGQKKFVSQILAVTRAEAPICGLTVNHGEPFAEMELADRENWTEYREFLDVIEGAGYEIQYLDLEKDEIPENCRLIISYDPQKDFASAFGNDTGAISETRKLDQFLDQAYSFMVFVDADTPALPNLEEYLEIWGIEFARYNGEDTDGNKISGSYQVIDVGHAVDGTGSTFVGQYGDGSMVDTVFSDIMSAAAMPKIVFSNAMAITFSPTYENKYVLADEDEGTEAYSYGYYNSNHAERAIFELFCAGTSDSPATAYAVANGERLLDKNGNEIVSSVLDGVMTLTSESRLVNEGIGQNYTSVNEGSYVCAVGSTDFAKDALLGSKAYGNADVLLTLLRSIGREVEPIDLWTLRWYSPDIGTDYYTDTETGAVTDAIMVTTVLLALIPALAVAGIGIYVLVKRRVRR